MLALLASATLRAETVVNVSTIPEAGVTIRLAVPWTQTPRYGFAPVRVSIENKADRERTWQVQFQAGMRNLFPGMLTTGHDITVPAGQTRDVWIYVPVAEPGTNIASGPMGGGMAVKIAPTFTGMKVTRTMGAGLSKVEFTTDFNTKTGAITTTTAGLMSTNTRTQAAPSRPGVTVTYTIDPTNGNHTSSTEPLGDPKAPTVYKVVVGAPGSSRTPRVPPRAAVAAATAAKAGGPPTIPGPSTPMMLVAEVTGPGIAGTGRLTLPGSSTPNGMRPFAVSPTLEPIFRGKLSTLVSGAPNIAAIEPAQLPGDWRVWSGFSGVLITTDEYAALDSGRRSALRAWVALGGQLGLSPTTSASDGGGESLIEKIGAGSIVTLAKPLSLFDTSFPATLPTTAAAASPSGTAGTPSPADVQKEIQNRWDARATGSTWVAAAPGAATAVPPAPAALFGNDIVLFGGTVGLPDRESLSVNNSQLYDVVMEEGGSSAWLAIFLVCFAVAVGPLNLFLFAPAKRRHRLFLTTPLIALVASVLLVVAIFLGDGTGGTGSRRAFVVLLPGENSAAVFQEQAARTGFLVGRTFPLADDIAAANLPFEPSMLGAVYGGSETQLTRDGGRAGGDWFRSRGRQAQQLRRIVPTRARVELIGTAPNGAPIVQSSLGTTMRGFSYVDAAGKVWAAAELPSGQRVTLQSADEASAAVAKPIDGSPTLRAAVTSAGAPAPGRWSAQGGATELAPIATLASVRWTDADVHYTGELENGAAKPGGTL